MDHSTHMAHARSWPPDPFSRDTTGLPSATTSEIVELQDGASYDLRAGSVCKRIGEASVKMLAYNGSIPGPTLKVVQGAEVTIHFTNETDLETTVHWHGLRLENRFDGVPHGHHGMQAPVPIGGRYTYRVRFPDPGVYWYHPHIREDYTQELGLYGSIIVTPIEANYWAPVNREVALILDDILIEDSKIAAFRQSESSRTAMGRFGNVMLVHGEISYTLVAHTGEVVRLYLTNAANARIFNVGIPGARMKLVGGDIGRIEHEEFVNAVLLAPAERVVVDVYFEQAGQFALEHRTPDTTYTLGTVIVQADKVEHDFAREFAALRHSPELAGERSKVAADVERPPDKVLVLVGEMPGMRHAGAHQIEPIEWEDTMGQHNEMTSPRNMFWKLIDQETGGANHAIEWIFKVGERVKVRIVNDAHSDHPMQHPIHVHGQRFLVLSRDGVPTQNLAWKDTVLVRTGETVDILLEMSNPGSWMVHCHIAEHLEGGMMFSYHVHE